MSTRAAALAAKIEQGANELAAFAESLTDTEWRHVVRPDGRTVGVVIHHVASVYPIEIDLARAIGSGKAVTDVTWSAVVQLNAGHAKEHANVSKADAVKLLRENSRAAAAAVREFTDAQLDTAAPFGLAYDAPVTAQFVIEDHALRHSWHHRAKIKASLGR